MRFLGLVLMLMCLSSGAFAQLISPRPHCATIRNETGDRIFASIRSAYTANAAGEQKRHEGSFRLEKGEKTEVCSTGPFYPGYQVELVVKTMIPIFSCKTRLAGTITLTSSRDKDDVYRVTATCVPPNSFQPVP